MKKYNTTQKLSLPERVERAVNASLKGLVPPAIVDGVPLIRGTDEWNERERARQAVGCKVISIGFGWNP